MFAETTAHLVVAHSESFQVSNDCVATPRATYRTPPVLEMHVYVTTQVRLDQDPNLYLSYDFLRRILTTPLTITQDYNMRRTSATIAPMERAKPHSSICVGKIILDILPCMLQLATL